MWLPVYHRGISTVHLQRMGFLLTVQLQQPSGCICMHSCPLTLCTFSRANANLRTANTSVFGKALHQPALGHSVVFCCMRALPK